VDKLSTTWDNFALRLQSSMHTPKTTKASEEAFEMRMSNALGTQTWC